MRFKLLLLFLMSFFRRKPLAIASAPGYNERLRVRGVVRFRMYENDVLIEDYTKDNLVVLVGLSQLAALIGGATTDKFVDTISFGTNNAAPALSDTSITNAYSVPVTASFPNAGQVEFAWVLPVGQNNGVTIAEYGLICNDMNLFSRVTRTPVLKTNTIRLEGEWTIIFN